MALSSAQSRAVVAVVAVAVVIAVVVVVVVAAVAVAVAVAALGRYDGVTPNDRRPQRCSWRGQGAVMRCNC
eukprot:770202-Alexandrium_andersonii.AAC.1